jgi:hypothetical protein
LCEKEDERGLRVKARFCVDGSPENPSNSSLFLTHTSMIESSISEVQILEAICSGKLVDITDIDSAFNRTADYDDLQKIKKGYVPGQAHFCLPPCSG